MGAGVHGGFGNTAGASNDSTRIIFTRVRFEGSVKVNGVVRDVSRRVYQRNDIDFKYHDPETGKTNLQLMQAGKAPIGNDGNPVQLHHVLQKESGPMAEVREVTHSEYHRTLHGLVESGNSFRNNDDLMKQYNNFRKKYWRWRAAEYLKGGK